MSFDYSEMQRLERQKRKYKTFEEILMQTICQVRYAYYVDPHHLYIHKDLAWPLYHKNVGRFGEPRYQLLVDPPSIPWTLTYNKYPILTIMGMEAKLNWNSPVEQVVLMDKDGKPIRTIVLPDEVVAEILGFDKHTR